MFIVEQETTDYNERVATTRRDSDEPDRHTEHHAVE